MPKKILTRIGFALAPHVDPMTDLALAHPLMVLHLALAIRTAQLDLAQVAAPLKHARSVARTVRVVVALGFATIGRVADEIVQTSA
jgi:hypothetical protein